MALKPFHAIAGLTVRPQFLLKDHAGREYGVVEHYETDRRKPSGYVLLEFYTPDPAVKERPRIWLDLEAWAVVMGHGRNLPDADFEAGLNRYLQGFSEDERALRRDRARKARFAEVIDLAGKGFTIAYQEMFPGELKPEDFPVVEMAGRDYLVDDQYDIQPGDPRQAVTLVFVERPIPASGSEAAALAPEPQPSLIANWLFDEGYEIVTSSLPEDLVHTSIRALLGNKELEKIYRERRKKMRREGTLLGVKPKSYSPVAGS